MRGHLKAGGPERSERGKATAAGPPCGISDQSRRHLFEFLSDVHAEKPYTDDLSLSATLITLRRKPCPQGGLKGGARRHQERQDRRKKSGICISRARPRFALFRHIKSPVHMVRTSSQKRGSQSHERIFRKGAAHGRGSAAFRPERHGLRRRPAFFTKPRRRAGRRRRARPRRGAACPPLPARPPAA